MTARPSRLLRALCVITALTLISSPAFAHHDQATTRVGDTGGAQPWRWSRTGQTSRLDATITYRFSLFDRALAGSSAYTKSPLGSATLHWSTPALQATLSTGTLVGVRVPIGALVLSPATGEDEVLMGLGDVSLFVAQDVLALWGSDRAWSLWVRGGVTTPTGHHSAANALRVTDVSASASGAFGLTTYSARANLGAGAWSASGSLLAAWSASSWLDLQLGAEVAAPLTTTADDIRWGVDMGASATTRAALLTDRLWMTTGADYRQHTEDDVPTQDDVTGARGRASAGGRREVALRLGFAVAVTAPLLCAAEVGVPVWQQVDGVQLVERVSVTAGCAFSFGL